MNTEQADSKKSLRKPPWLKVKIPGGENYLRIKNARRKLALATVCEEASCPNIGECWALGTATFMIMGKTCTRACRFCNVATSRKPDPLDPLEPNKLADTIKAMDLEYVILTTVDRDELSDQGASHIRKCIERIGEANPKLNMEILMPDFRGENDLIDEVIASGAIVLAHNVETVRRLTSKVRDRRAGYDQSLKVLEYVKKKSPLLYTKSSLMVGLGESMEEILEAMRDMREVGVDFLTVGQYLQPRQSLLDVREFVHPDVFEEYRQAGLEMGFRYVASGPLVRSSYKAAEQFINSIINTGNQ